MVKLKNNILICGNPGVGKTILILDFLGRPFQIGRDPDWFQYDVYLVYVNGMISQAFKQNLRGIDD